MTSNNQTNTPSGLYVLSGFLLLSIIGILYYAITIPPYFYLAIILIPLFIYMGVGIIKQWPGVRNMLVVVTMLLLVGVIANVIVVLFIEGSQELVSAESIIKTILGLAILPAVFFYLRSEKVKSYFKQAT